MEIKQMITFYHSDRIARMTITDNESNIIVDNKGNLLENIKRNTVFF